MLLWIALLEGECWWETCCVPELNLPGSEPADVTGSIEPPDGGAESLVETGRRPLSRKIRMHEGGNGLSGEKELDLWFGAQTRIAKPRPFEVDLIDGTAKLRHESLRKATSRRCNAPFQE